MSSFGIARAVAAVTVLATSLTYADLVVHCGFEDLAASSTVADLAGGEQPGTVGCGASVVSPGSIVGFGALSLGSSGFVDAGALSLGDQFTIAAWWKLPSVGSSPGSHVLFADCASTRGATGIALYVNSEGTADRRLVLSTANGSVAGVLQTSDGAYPDDGAYHHVAVTVDRSMGTATIYLDGKSVSSGSIRTDFASNTASRVGAYLDGQGFAQATLDDVRIYNQVATAQTIAGLAWRYGIWESCRIGGGGQLYEIVFCPSDPNRIYVVSEVGGTFRSDDKGVTWKMINAGLPAMDEYYYPRALSVDPRNADKLVLAIGTKASKTGGILTSDDGGMTWVIRLKRATARWFEGDGQFRTGGEVLVRDAYNPNVLIAGTTGPNIYRSTNNGVDWTPVAMPAVNGITNVVPADIMVDRSRPGRMWLASPPYYSSILYSPCLYFSSDSGNTWTPINTTAADIPMEMVQNPVQPDVIYGLTLQSNVVDSNQGHVTLLKRSSGTATERPGTTWQAYSNWSTGLPAYPTSGSLDRSDGVFTTLVAVPDGSVLAGGNGANFYSLGGPNYNVWTRRGWTGTIVADEGNQWWGRIGVSFQHCGSHLATAAISPIDGRWAFTDWYAIYFSTNQGNSWRPAIDGIEMTVQHTVHQQAASSAAGLPDAIHVGCGDVGYFRGSGGDRMLTQPPYDANTNNITNNIKCITSTAAQPKRLYAVGPSQYSWAATQVFISSTNGANWIRCAMKNLPGGERDTIVADPKTADTVWLAVAGKATSEVAGLGQGGIFKSSDAATTWAHVAMPTTTTDQAFFSSNIWNIHQELAVDTAGTVVAASNSKFRVHALIGGAWYGASTGTQSPNAVVADPSSDHPGTFYMALQYRGFFRSNDSGKTWKRLGRSASNDTAFAVAVNQDDPRWVAYVTYTGDIRVSADRGDTWRTLSGATLPMKSHRNVVAFGGKYIYVGTPGNEVFRAELIPNLTPTTPEANTINEALITLAAM